MKRAVRILLILFTIGTFVSAAQGALAGEPKGISVAEDSSSPAESCFLEEDVLDMCLMPEGPGAAAFSRAGIAVSSPPDTLET